MSTTIDQRVVEMRFDNKQFESNVQTSMSTISKLKQSLNFTGATKSLENIDSSVKKVNFSGLSGAVESIQAKFSSLEVIAVTALANITNSAINAGKKIISALTIDPITTGFQEYETQINAIQTILANTQSKGTTLTDVNSALNELNKYADQTIYNFTEMTRNIGTFTAAGVDLDKSVTSIKGIANLAAVSGSNAQQASTAMYQLSQALATGKVSLMDWNSVVNAGMGGEVFQTALKRTATQMGYNVDELIKKYGSFRESLTEGGWLTAEVLTETLTQLSGAYTEADLIAQGYSESQAKQIVELANTAISAATDVKTFTQLWDTLKETAQSGWTKTWEILIGDFEESKDLLSEISDTFGDIINASSESRNALLSDAMTSNWKKLTDGINEAGLSVEDFKSKVIEIGKAQGIADIDEIIADYGSLEAAFKNGALSSSLLDQALIKMTGSSEEISKKLKDLRGEYKSNKTIINALTEAGYENSDIQDLITKSLKGETIALNDLSDSQLLSLGYTAEQIKSIRELSKYSEIAGGSLKSFTDNIAVPRGRELLIDSFRVSLRSLISIFETVGKAWREVFPPMTSEQLYSIIKSLQEFVLTLRPSEETLNNLQRTFRGLFSILSIGKEAISAIISAIGSLLGHFDGLGSGILSTTASFGDWLFNLNETIKKTDVFGKALQVIVDVIETIVAGIKDFANLVRKEFEKIEIPGLEIFHDFLERIQIRMSQIGEAAGEMNYGVSEAISAMGDALANSNFMKMLRSLWNLIKSFGNGLVNIFRDLGSGLASAVGSINFDRAFDIVNTAALGGVALAIKNFMNNLSEPLEGIQNVLGGVSGILDGVKGSLEAYQESLKADVLIKIATAIGILAASILVISTIDSEKLSASLGSVTVLFADLMASMALFSRISGTMVGVTKTCAAMIALSTAVLILATALKQISGLDFGSMVTGLVGIITLSATMVIAAKSLSKGTSTVIKGAAQMVIFAAAIKILASACEDLGALSWEELAKGLIGVGVLLAEVSIFMNTAKFSSRSITTATGITILAAAMLILAAACSDFGQLDWEEIAKGLVSIGVLLGELAIFSKLTANAGNLITTGTGLVIIAASMKVFASSVKDFSEMSWEELIVGLTGMAGALSLVTVAVNLMPKNMIGIGVGLIAVSAALLLMADSLNNLSGMSWEEIAKGLVALGGSMGILAAGLNLMNGTLSGSAALLVAVAALAVLAPVLSVLGAMSWEAIAKGLITLAGAFTVIGVAGLVLTPLVPTILSLGAAFALIGVGIAGIGAGLLAAGAGLSALAVGFTSIGVAGAAGAAAIVSALTIIITGIAALIPEVLAQIGEGIIAFCDVIAEGAPAIGEAVKAVVLSLVDVIVECVPAIADGALELVSGVLEALVKYTPEIVESIFQFLIKLLEGIADNLPELIEAAIKVVVAFFEGIVDALSGIDTSSLVKAIAGVGLVSGIMLALSAAAALVPGAMAGILGLGLVVAELALVLTAIGAIAQIPGLKWIINEGGILLESLGNAIGSFIGGIVGGVLGGITGKFPEIGNDLSSFMTNLQPFVEGAKSIDSSVTDGIKTLAETILILTAANILDGLTSWLTGGSSLTKFAKDLIPFGTAMKHFSKEISGMDGELVENAATAGKALAEMASSIPNSGGLVTFFTGENDMGVFSEQIVEFGKAMKAYSEVISGIDSKVVADSATAGKALTEMASTVPNSGGLLAFFAGENDIDDFAKKIVPFGKAMKDYSDSVVGLKASVITDSTTAGKALIELANTVPNSGGVWGFFAGENDVDDFGAKLVPFGKAMKEYGDAVKGIDADSIVNSATAGNALVELAETVPNTGGLVAFFSGDNDLAAFGEQLISFGESMAKYSESVKDIEPDVVTTTANAADSLVTLAEKLPEDKLFKNETTLDDFGKQLSKFGEYFRKYYDSVSGIEAGTLTPIVEAVGDLVDIAKGMGEVDTGAMGSFGKALSKLGKTGIEEFVKAFKDSTKTIQNAATEMVNTFIDAANSKSKDVSSTFTNLISDALESINSKSSEFKRAGSECMSKFVSGIQSRENSSTSAFRQIISNCLTSITSKNQSFYTAGQSSMGKFVEGIKSKESIMNSSFTTMLNSAINVITSKKSTFVSSGESLISGFTNAISSKNQSLSSSFTNGLSLAVSSIKSYYTNFYNAGSYLAMGFANGISSQSSVVAKKASNMASVAYSTTMNKIQARSPSKLFTKVGSYVPLGFARGIENGGSEVEKSISYMTKTAVESTSKTISKIIDAFNGDIDTQPTIRPVLDLSNVQAGTKKINALFSSKQAISISSDLDSDNGSKIQNGVSGTKNGSVFQFTQNNYSPKALSRVEIYRQTNNQFSAFERMAET